MRRTLIGIAMLASLPAAGQSADRIARLMQDLDSPSFVTRELAEDELEFDRSLTLDMLEEQLRRDDISQEQRIRLLKAASMRFSSEPRAAMGIQLSSEINELGLKINGPVEGFDAMGKLQANDIVSVIGELPIRSSADLQAAIISRSPGEVVPVEIVRAAERLTIDIRLGAWSELSTPGGIPRASVEAAWVYRSRDYAGKDEPEIIDFDVDINAWNAAASRPWGGQGPRRDSGVAIRPMIVVGGEARPRPGAMAGVRLDRPLAASARGRASDFPPLLKQELIKAEIDIIATQERIRRLQVQLELYKQNAARPLQVQQVEKQIADFEQILDELNRRGDRIRQELEGMGIKDP